MQQIVILSIILLVILIYDDIYYEIKGFFQSDVDEDE